MEFDTEGAATGAATGAVVGSVFPGVGTAAGAIGGGLIGGFMGNSLSAQTSPYYGEGQANQAYAVQGDALGMMRAGAMGQGPSAAQQMVERNRSQNAAQAVGMAKSMGGDPGLANRNMTNQIARGNADASYQGALLRAQEQQAAQQAYLQGATAARGQGIELAGQRKNMAGQNASNRAGFLGGMLNMGGGLIGGFM